MRLVLFSLAQFVVLVSVILSYISASQPHWIHQASRRGSPLQGTEYYGLFEKCSVNPLDGSSYVCRKYPKLDDCREPLRNGLYSQRQDTTDEDLPSSSSPLLPELVSPGLLAKHKRRHSGFCSYWQLAGYFSQLSIAFGAASLLSLLVVMGGGRKRRKSGWPLCAGLVCFHAAFQVATFALVMHAYRSDDRFADGSALAFCAWTSLTSWILDLLLALIMIGTGLLGHWDIPERRGRGYTAIPDSDE